MKAAYLAYDKTSLAGLPTLSNYFEQIDVYLVDDSRPAQMIDFNLIPVLSENLLIPAEDGLQTTAHQAVIKGIQKELFFYKSELHKEYRKSSATFTQIQKSCKTEMNLVSTIKDVVFNAKTNEVYIEKAKSGITAYNYLFVEDHQVVTESFGAFTKNIFKKTPQNSHVWFSAEFKYELKKPREKTLDERQFILIKDRLNKSVLDNWYLVRTEEDRITVQQWVPFNQFRNSDFQKFIIERVEKLLREKLDIVQLTQFNGFNVNATPGHALGQPILKNSKISSLIPSFNFWSQETVNRFLYDQLDIKMKELNQKLLMLQNLPRG